MNPNVTSNIRKLYIIKISKWLMLTMPILFLFYKENGLITQDLFLLKAAYSISIVIMEIPSGYFGDIWGRKNSLILGSVLGFIGFALYFISHSFWSFLACEMILGIGQSFISGSDSALLYDTLLEAGEKKNYTKIEGRLISLGNFAEAIAAPIGVMLAIISFRTTFFFQAVVAFSAVPASILLYEPGLLRLKKSPPKENVNISCRNKELQKKRELLKIIQYALVENRLLKWHIYYSSIMGTATLTMAWFVQPCLVHFTVPLGLYGIIIPLLNLTAGVTAMHAWKFEKRMGQHRTTLFIVFSIASGYFLVGLATPVWAMLFLFLFYIARGIATPVLRNYINEITPSEIRATVLSIRSLVIRLSFVILGPILGWTADTAGIPSALTAGGAIFLIGGVLSGMALMKCTDERLAHQSAPFNALS